jgi:hypothetical protein
MHRDVDFLLSADINAKIVVGSSKAAYTVKDADARNQLRAL